METLIELGLEATKWLQGMYPQWETFMRLFSEFGRFELYLAVVPLVYWCISKRLGTHFAYLLIVSTVLNYGFKHLFRQPRPSWVDPALTLSESESYGFPSGHVQTATVVFFLLSGWIRENWLWIFSFLYIFLMTLSRIYLGVHFIHDVIGGFLVSIAILGGYLAWRQYGERRFMERLFGQRLLAVTLVPLALLVLYLAIILLRGEPDETVAWASQLELAEREAMEGVIGFIGVMLATGIGITLEQSRVCFKVAGEWWKRVLRYVLGMLVTVAIWAGLRPVFDSIAPPDLLWLALPLRFIRYFMFGIWVTYYAPMAFVMLNLCDHSVEPEVQFTVAGASLRRKASKKKK